MEYVKSVFRGLDLLLRTFLFAFLILVVCIGPAMVSSKSGNEFWLLLYIPHVLVFLYFLGQAKVNF
jgi:hypothetical protein